MRPCFMIVVCIAVSIQSGYVIGWYMYVYIVERRINIQRPKKAPQNGTQQESGSKPRRSVYHHEAIRTRARTRGVSALMVPSVKEKMSRMLVLWRRKTTTYCAPRFCACSSDVPPAAWFGPVLEHTFEPLDEGDSRIFFTLPRNHSKHPLGFTHTVSLSCEKMSATVSTTVTTAQPLEPTSNLMCRSTFLCFSPSSLSGLYSDSDSSSERSLENMSRSGRGWSSSSPGAVEEEPLRVLHMRPYVAARGILWVWSDISVREWKVFRLGV